MNRTRLICAAVCVLLLELAVPRSSNASLIGLDGWTNGDQLLTLDSQTGLAWLDLSVTDDRSYADIFLNDYSGLLTLGFRAPSEADVLTLLHDAGAPDGELLPSWPPTVDGFADATNFISLFGCTLCDGRRSIGYVISESNGARYAGVEVFPEDGTGGFGASDIDQFNFQTDFGLAHHQADTGFFLAMDADALGPSLFAGPPPPLPPGSDPTPGPVPEPSAAWLLGFGFAGVFGARYQRSTVRRRSGA